MNKVLFKYLLAGYFKRVLLTVLIVFCFGLIFNLFEEIEFFKNLDTTVLIPITLTALFIPSLAVAIRRLHDIGKSGWYYLLVLIPIIGAIWLIVLFVTEGEQGENQYGPNPKNDNFENRDF